MKGFTLIEMLVVVLIMGILASVALPQYQKTIVRSRATEAIMTARSIIASQNRSLDAYPNDPVNTRSALDISLPDGTWINDNTYITNLFQYTLTNDAVTVKPISGASYILTLYNNNSPTEVDSCGNDTSFCASMREVGFHPID